MTHTARLMMLVAALITADLGAARAEAATITWYWAGPVTGHIGDTAGGPSLDLVVPFGTMVDVWVSLDPDAPYLNPDICLQGTASASLRVLGRTYTNYYAWVWVDSQGWYSGGCDPGSNRVDIVVPVWGGSEPLPGGWVPFNDGFLPGIWWSGDLNTQPTSIESELPFFYLPGESTFQRFAASLEAVPQPVPEPSTWLLLGTGLLVAAWRRRRHH